MHFLQCVLMLNFIISDDALGFIVRGPSGPLVVRLGGSVILPCYVETPLVAEQVKVVWKRTDSETLVHLYQDGESRAEAQQQDYHDRAHFFTDQIQHGNFSLRLDNLTAEDKGVYRCKVYSQKVADKTLVEIKDVERLLVSGSSRSISASVGEDVTLNCSVDSHITPEHTEEVSWRKTNKDGHILVLFYQNNQTLSDSSDERYRDRAEFFTDEIPKGNFSLRLKSVRTEDKGVYMCQVFAGGLSANATAELEQLGFSWLHITVLILCIIAPVSALLLCWLVYSGSENQVLLAEHFENISAVIITVTISLLVLMCLLFITELAEKKLLSCCGELRRRMYKKVRVFVATSSFSWLPSLQLALLLYTHFASNKVFIITALPVLHWLFYFFWNEKKCCLRCLYYLIWLMKIVMSGVMVYFYIMLLRNEKADAGPVCVAGFVQALWVLAFSEVPVYYEKLSMRKMMFLYGSAGLVLVNSAALMTELIMKAVYGVRLVGDLRAIVFLSEWLFTVALLILSLLASWKPVNTESQEASRMSIDYNATPGTKHTSVDMNQMTGESVEMETLRKVSENSEEHQEEEFS
uniref:Ig-like domain-containing protein n=1 Tax=Cyprinus carpio TaxID=7962 RepID=A0A8C1YHE4_CYPCA